MKKRFIVYAVVLIVGIIALLYAQFILPKALQLQRDCAKHSGTAYSYGPNEPRWCEESGCKVIKLKDVPPSKLNLEFTPTYTFKCVPNYTKWLRP